MAILLSILSAIGVIIGLLWRLNQAGEATRGAMETARDVRGMARGFAWRRKAKRHPMELLSDPREAAVAMLAAVAEHDGAMTATEMSCILTNLSTTFGASKSQADDLLAHGRWLARDVPDLGDFLRRAVPLIQTQCDARQKSELMAMLRQTAAIDGGNDDVVTSALDRLEYLVSR